jgi:hypothetical protein
MARVLEKMVKKLLGVTFKENDKFFLFPSGQDCRQHLEDITRTQGMIIKLPSKKAKN